MGVGFLAMGFIRIRGVEVKPAIAIPRTLPSMMLIVIGFLMVIIGVTIIFYSKMIWPHIAGLSAIITGFLILIWGIMSLRGR